jgi:hypothetical protein
VQTASSQSTDTPSDAAQDVAVETENQIAPPEMRERSEKPTASTDEIEPATTPVVEVETAAVTGHTGGNNGSMTPKPPPTTAQADTIDTPSASPDDEPEEN